MTREIMSAQASAKEPPRGCCLNVAAGIVLMLVGIPMLVLPGPGIVVIGAGAMFILRGFGIRTHRRDA